MRNIQKYFSFLWYYVGWFSCIYLAKIGDPVLSLLFPVVLIFLLWRWGQVRLISVVSLFVLALVGMLFDFIMRACGHIDIGGGQEFFLPIWLISIWLLFVFIVPQMVPLFRERLFLAGILGGIVGPLSYVSGGAMGVLFMQKPRAIYFYIFFWLIYFPVAIYFGGKSLQHDRRKPFSDIDRL